MAQLRSETNTREMGTRVLEAAHEALAISKTDLIASFGYGQWWITQSSTGAQWSVVDAIGFETVDGFGFEQVSELEDED